MAAKPWHRLKLIGFNTVYSLTGQLSGIVLSLLVIRVFSDSLWGAYSSFSIWLLLPLHFAYFGNKDFLMRAYSTSPSTIAESWSRSFLCRLVILLPVLLLTYILARHKPLAIDLVVLALFRFLIQSFDSLTVYFQKFSRSVRIELGALLFILIACIFYKVRGLVFGIDELIGILIVAEAVKSILYTFLFKKYIHLTGKIYHFRMYMKESIPFLLIGLSGMLASKSDLIFSNFYFSKEALAHYQVLTNFLVFIQAGSVYLLQPFVRNIYRLRKQVVQNLAIKLAMIGLAASVLGIAGLYVLLEFIYRLHFHPAVYLLSSLFVLPVYIYSPYIYYMYKANKQSTMVLLNFAGIGISLFTAWMLFRIYSPAPIYLLLGICAQQVFLLFAVSAIFRKINLS
jgi:O-antigen/teichoic acid export membrane protein